MNIGILRQCSEDEMIPTRPLLQYVSASAQQTMYSPGLSGTIGYDARVRALCARIEITASRTRRYCAHTQLHYC